MSFVDGGGIMRCVEHPSQFFTGFCSSCLAERLTNVDSPEVPPKPLGGGRQSEIMEVAENLNAGNSTEEKINGHVRVRKTLLYLFQLDDKGTETQLIEGGQENPSYSAAVDVIVGAQVSRKTNRSFEGENLKEKSSSFWLTSILSKKVFSKWKSRSNGSQRGCGAGDEELETNKSNARHSIDGSGFRDTRKVSWEAPRHSWDGSAMSKALSCSFACLNEQEAACCRVRRNLTEETPNGESNVPESADSIRINSVAMTLSAEKHFSPNMECYHDELQETIAVSNIIRKKSNRWSKVWDRSITSPFKDSLKKRGLARSLSESWRDSGRNIEGEESVSGNGVSSVVKNQSLSRSIKAAGADGKILRPDWKKNEISFRRSRSVHYSSPGNLDNGLLRLYLTPLRSSRRSSKKGRSKRSRSFARGIFGL